MLVRSARVLSLVVASSAVLLVASSAAAQSGQGAGKKAATVKNVDGHDVYDFPDDPLMGDDLSANVVRVPVLRHAAATRSIAARHFS